MVIPLFVGRPKSIKALEAAMESGKGILLVRKIGRQGRAGSRRSYSIGCVANILQMLKLPGRDREGAGRGHPARVVDRSTRDECSLPCSAPVVAEDGIDHEVEGAAAVR